MYNLSELLGKVVTVCTAQGNEYIATLTGHNEDKSVITLEHPKLVFVNDTSVSLAPFALTALGECVHMNTNNILAVLSAMDSSAQDYQRVIEVGE